jgi:formylmethanofuran dehydrogenase subunit C
MPLTLTLRQPSQIPIEVEGVTPAAIRGLSVDEIERIGIYHGNRAVPLAEWFSVRGNPADEHIVFEGDLGSVHWIAAKMTSGKIDIHGDAGRHLGSEMSGGEIVARGNASDWAGAQMRGGMIRIHGSAGDLAGAAYRGSPQGMAGGTILIHGRAGHEIGAAMRRGLIAVAGDAGDLAGYGMLAGSIFVLGRAGMRPGAQMSRGTIALLGPQPPPLLPSFRYACRFQPEMLRLMFRQLQGHGFPLEEPHSGTKYDLYNGDLLALGRGEILLPAL